MDYDTEREIDDDDDEYKKKTISLPSLNKNKNKNIGKALVDAPFGWNGIKTINATKNTIAEDVVEFDINLNEVNR